MELVDESTRNREPLAMYAHSSLTPLLAAAPAGPQSCIGADAAGREEAGGQGPAAAAGQQGGGGAVAGTPLVGCRLRLGGMLNQPYQVGQGAAGRSRGRQSQQPGGRHLPTRALVLELDGGDAAWSSSELSGHRVLGGCEMGRVYDLSAVVVRDRDVAGEGARERLNKCLKTRQPIPPDMFRGSVFTLTAAGSSGSRARSIIPWW